MFPRVFCHLEVSWIGGCNQQYQDILCCLKGTICLMLSYLLSQLGTICVTLQDEFPTMYDAYLQHQSIKYMLLSSAWILHFSVYQNSLRNKQYCLYCCNILLNMKNTKKPNWSNFPGIGLFCILSSQIKINMSTIKPYTKTIGSI